MPNFTPPENPNKRQRTNHGSQSIVRASDQELPHKTPQSNTINESPAQRHYNNGENARKANNIDDALKYYFQALNQDSRFVLAYKAIANIYTTHPSYEKDHEAQKLGNTLLAQAKEMEAHAARIEAARKEQDLRIEAERIMQNIVITPPEHTATTPTAPTPTPHDKSSGNKLNIPQATELEKSNDTQYKLSKGTGEFTMRIKKLPSTSKGPEIS